MSEVSKPTEQAVQRRHAILRAALDVFGTKGYRNGTLQEIAELVGMTRAGVLHHFGSKEQLLIAVLDYRDLADVEALSQAQAPRGGAFFDHLHTTVVANEQRAGIVQAYTVLSADSVTEDHPGHEFFRSRYDGLRDMVERALRQHLHDTATPMPPDEEIVDAASAVIAVMDGSQIQWLLHPDAISMPRTLLLVLRSIFERWGLPLPPGLERPERSSASR